MALKMIDLFAGIGGMALGADWVFEDDIEHVLFSEINPFCQKILRYHWRDTPIIPDVRDVNRESVSGSIDIITGGFPCQPFSVAGRQAGTEDDRYLWDEMYRIIKELTPTWVLTENVSGLINMALDTVASDLEAAGYEVGIFVLGACSVDAPHIRKRVFVLGNAKHDGSHSTKVRGSNDKPSVTPKQITLWESSGASSVQSGADVSDADGKRCQEFGLCSSTGDEDEAKTPDIQAVRCGEDVSDAGQVGRQGRDREAGCQRGKPEAFDGSQDVSDSGSEYMERCRSGRKQESPKVYGSPLPCSACQRSRSGSGASMSRLDLSADGFSRWVAERAGYRWRIEPFDDYNNCHPEGWTPYFDTIPRVTMDRSSRAKKIEALGNAVVPALTVPFFEYIRLHT